MTYASAALFAVSWASEDLSRVHWNGEAVGSIVYLALVGSVVAFVIYYSLLKHVPVGTLAFVAYTFPVAAFVLGYFLLGEGIERKALIGAAIVVVGIAVATVSRPR